MLKEIKKSDIQFITKCAIEAAGTTEQFMMSQSRKRKAVIARQLFMWHFRTECHKDISLSEIGDLLNKDHATVYHSKEVVDNVTLKADDQLFEAKQKFIFLKTNFTMETLLIECEKRDDEKNKADKDRIHRMHSLQKYNRSYKKVIVKLIRTEDKMPTKRDFALIDHILNY